MQGAVDDQNLMKEKEEMNVLPEFYFIVSVVIFYLFLGYIYLPVSLYIVYVSYPSHVRSTMEIRRSHLCDFFLVLPFYNIFSYEILCCK